MSGGLSFNVGAKKGPKLAFGLKTQQKPSRASTVFAPDSDEEEEAPEQQQKRQRRSSPEAANPATTADASSHLTSEERTTAEKLADFVARHGRNFEEVTRQRNPHGGPFKFLFDTSSPGYEYYEKQLEEHMGKLQSGFLASTPVPPAPPPAAPRLNSAAQPPNTMPRLNPPAAPPQQPPQISLNAHSAKDGPEVKGAPPGDSLAAMEAFTKLAAKRDEQRVEQEAKIPLLNETSFDRRRTMAVYKNDGSRGHHMQDYIPQEELAKFMAKSGSAEAKAQAEAIEAASRIQSDNIGHKLLSQMGWKEGQGLGAQGRGMAAPVAADTAFGSEKRGLGAADHTAPQEGDDEFETYRKRMMLGYKHRPNPLGNPRKSYY